ncbi:MAG: carbonic [Planctomycetota bacterium]|nr:MAG: carbonic [Planctomycetota bacterium]
MDAIDRLINNNLAWAARMKKERPGFFEALKDQQSPEFLWIGCADSRVPANEIVGLLPGELFVHRNVANLVIPSDLNCISVIQFAIDVLRVKHVIVCGHYGCTGIEAAIREEEIGVVDNWLMHVRHTRDRHENEIDALETEEARFRRLCEINVVEQVQNVAHTTPVQHAWRVGQELTIHGLIYGVEDGLIKDLGIRAANRTDVTEIRKRGERG